MRPVIFIGPTISESKVTEIVDAICLPPVAQGDVYRAMRHNPTCIGIIDGYFDGVAAVWHKEILWALSQGVQVFGASSMGALRACELADFGMTGIGKIYRQFHSGMLEDDDEVAVIHGPAELGFPALSEPMVNIRVTLKQAVCENVLQQGAAEKLELFAKSLHYRQRTWEKLIANAGSAKEFEDWLKEGKVDQKHLDAVAMLEAIAQKVQKSPQTDSKHQPSFDFELTNQWERATRQWEAEFRTEAPGDLPVLDELRLQPDAFYSAREASVSRDTPRQQKTKIRKGDLLEAINAFRVKHKLLNRAQLDKWLEENKLTPTELETLLTNELHVKNSVDLGSAAFKQSLLNHLKLTGNYHAFATRARDKQDRLAIIGQPNPHPQATGLQKPALLEWYFCQHLKVKIPSNLNQYANEIGLENRDEFYQMLAREYLYLHGGEGE